MSTAHEGGLGARATLLHGLLVVPDHHLHEGDLAFLGSHGRVALLIRSIP
jgi:hypothetical protein